MEKQDLKGKRIGVLMGGLSREREISLRSGQNCLAALGKLGYEALAIDVGRDVAETLRRERVEVAFLALHGRYGEDGAIQGLLEFLDIPYTGSRVLASATGMNKIRTKQLAAYRDVPTPQFAVFRCRDDLKAAAKEAAELLTFPLMVKPCEEGSSIGVARVHDREELEAAVTATCAQYGMALAEEFVTGTEVTVGLLESEREIMALPVLQVVPHADFYDFEAKYNKGMTDFIVPADLPDPVTTRAQDLAILVHRTLGCRGFSRVDFIVDSTDTPQLTEINTIPGMTETSDLPAQANAAGIGYEELVEMMLFSALLP